jgi:Ca-activated chloride channel homolog
MKHLKLSSLLFLFIVLLSCGSNAQRTVYEQPFPDKPDVEKHYSSSGKQTVNGKNVTFSAAFSNDYYTNNQHTGTYYVELKTDDVIVSDKSVKSPLNISIVIDRSGSMSGDKLKYAKIAAKYVIDQLSENDYVSVVEYDNTVDVKVAAQSASNKQSIKNAIETIFDRGGTNLCGGAVEGYRQVKKNYNSNYINRVLLLSDGLANEGITNPSQIENIVKNQMVENGITISTFGLGRDYNEDLMTAMAENGNGNYYFIEKAKDVSNIFEKELNGVSRVLAQNVEIKIEVPEFVNITKVYGAKYDQTGRVIKIPLRDVFCNETKSVLIKYTINNNISSSVNFGTTLNYTLPKSDYKKPLVINSKQEFTNNDETYKQHFNEWVQAQEVLYQSNEKLETAMREVDKGNYKEAKKLVEENDNYLRGNEKLVQQTPMLQQASSANTSYTNDLGNIEAMDESARKSVQKAVKSTNYSIRNKK